MNWAHKHRLRAKIIMYTGWVLFFYAVTHLLNHMLGLFGLGPLEWGREIFIAFWRIPVFEWLVVICLILHFLAVLHKLFFRSTFKGMRGIEWTQLIIGLLIPDLMIHHIFETKMAHEYFGIVDSYTYYIFWMPSYYYVLMIFMLTIIWIHGVIGIWSYIKQKSWFPKWKNWLLGLAVAWPILASTGIVTAIREVSRLRQDPQWVDQMFALYNPTRFDVLAWEHTWEYQVSGAYFGFLLLFFICRKMFLFVKRKRTGIVIKYLEGLEVNVHKGTSILEASLMASVPHAHVCGGRGRCSTCRVQIIDGFDGLPPPSNDEVDLLTRVKCGKTVRLACRTRPTGNVTVYPILLPSVSLKQSLWKKSHYTGMDCDVAILFADLRGFTSMAEDKLPYDVVFVLNQYFQLMGQAIEHHQGRIDKFIGDAIMAVFGIGMDRKEACRHALSAARSMRLQLDRLNDQLKNELPEPLQMGFGIHYGHVIIGEMGYKDSNNLVAIGDATNTASRLESLTKNFNCELIVSEEAIRGADINVLPFEKHEVEIRGRQRLMTIYAVKDVKGLEVLNK